jgi:hypothetical protein
MTWIDKRTEKQFTLSKEELKKRINSTIEMKSNWKKLGFTKTEKIIIKPIYHFKKHIEAYIEATIGKRKFSIIANKLTGEIRTMMEEKK